MWEIVDGQRKYVNIQGNGQVTLNKGKVVMGTKLISEKQNMFFFLKERRKGLVHIQGSKECCGRKVKKLCGFISTL